MEREEREAEARLEALLRWCDDRGVERCGLAVERRPERGAPRAGAPGRAAARGRLGALARQLGLAALARLSLSLSVCAPSLSLSRLLLRVCVWLSLSLFLSR